MKCILRMGVWFAAAFLLHVATGMAQAQTQPYQPFGNPIIQPELENVDDFQELVKETLPELKRGFALAGALDLFDGFVRQVDQSRIETVEMSPGENLLWMIFIKGQGVDVVRNVVRAGQASFKAFLVAVEKDGNRHVFVVPAMCGHVGLAWITALHVRAPMVMNATPASLPVVAAPATVKTMGASLDGK